MIYRKTLVFKTLPTNLPAHMSQVIQVVNFVFCVRASDTRSTSHWIKEYKVTEMLIHNSLQGRSSLVRAVDTEDERTLLQCTSNNNCIRALS